MTVPSNFKDKKVYVERGVDPKIDRVVINKTLKERRSMYWKFVLELQRYLQTRFRCENLDVSRSLELTYVRICSNEVNLRIKYKQGKLSYILIDYVAFSRDELGETQALLVFFLNIAESYGISNFKARLPTGVPNVFFHERGFSNESDSQIWEASLAELNEIL